MYALSAFLDSINLKLFEQHYRVISLTSIVCHALFLASFPASSYLAGKRYTGLSAAKKIDWGSRVVSHVFACVVVVWSAALFKDETLNSDRLFGYTPVSGDLMAVAIGYFFWDVYVCLRYLHIFGLGFLAHAISCFMVFLFSMRPFLIYFGIRVLLWELSTPFLNINWFCDKLGLTGSKLQLYNGIALVTIFFFARVVFGWWTSYHFFHTFYTRRDELPMGIPWIYAAGNVILNSLNAFWFTKLISGIQRRFSPRKSGDTSRVKAQ